MTANLKKYTDSQILSGYSRTFNEMNQYKHDANSSAQFGGSAVSRGNFKFMSGGDYRAVKINNEEFGRNSMPIMNNLSM